MDITISGIGTYGGGDDPARKAIEHAIRRFSRTFPNVVLVSKDATTRLLTLSDERAISNVRIGRVDADDFSDGILSFLILATILKAGISIDFFQSSTYFRRFLTRTESVYLSEDDLGFAQGELWCTIWPLCPTGS